MILFAGPSLTTRSRELTDSLKIELRSPVKRRDIDRLVAEGYTGIIAIADGVFNQSAAVGHAEIRRALEHGCTVYGLSSMGAIRAWEMRNLGMIGYGRVYSYFTQMADFQDDEMALLHGPEPEYIAFSEPMVHFRYCIHDLLNKHLLSDYAAEAVIAHMKNRYFGKRTMALFVEILEYVGHPDPESVITSFDQYRIKQKDLITFLEEEVWNSNMRS